MASTFSPTLRLELIGDGDQSGIWGQTTNNNLGGLLEQSITGVVTINMLDANYILSSFNGVVDEARNQVLVLTGTLSTQRNLVAPLVEKTYTIKNTTTGGFSVQIIGASGTGVIIPNGITASVYCDGTNFFPTSTGTLGNHVVNGNLAVTGTTALTGNLTGSTAAFSGAISSVNPVFTGTPTAPTALAGTSTTQIATTAFVQNVAGALGTLSSQNANNVAITGGTITGISGSNPSMSVGTATNANFASTAGVASTAGSANQFQGKSKLGLGITGEVWNNVTGSRSQGVNYTNSRNYPIQVVGNFGCNFGGQGQIYINGVLIAFWQAQFNGCGGFSVNMPCIVPAGATYQLAAMAGEARGWYELF
jgi:hypothetical protein